MNAAPQPALTAERRRVLQAVVERILPGTDGPGAVATGAAVGVERAVLHPYVRGLRPAIETVLDKLEAQAVERFAQGFGACAAQQQDELLRGLQHDPQGWPRMVLRSLIWFSLEGLLGDPAHGGNRDFLGWRAAGLDPQAVRAGLCRAPEAAQ